MTNFVDFQRRVSYPEKVQRAQLLTKNCLAKLRRLEVAQTLCSEGVLNQRYSWMSAFRFPAENQCTNPAQAMCQVSYSIMPCQDSR